ncbi:MAG: mevalonate kinase [Silvanigrellales bacterium]|jgi:mevalonate kinase|nr:mevalonate kinase [Silvanigrellales bacterium]
MPERASNASVRSLGPSGASARASGKAILLGEHSVVYGHPALALALGEVGLRVELGGDALSWEEGITLRMRGCVGSLPAGQRARIVEGFEKALHVTGLLAPHERLPSFAPRELHIDTAIPLGAGMGGSAAMSTAFVRLALSLANNPSQEWNPQRIASAANDVDGLFHGKASGLDAAAVSSDGIIRFCHGNPLGLVTPGAPFHLVLIDSGERSSTADMVALVAQKKVTHPKETQSALDTLGKLTNEAQTALEGGNLKELGRCLDFAHVLLKGLGVSTPRMDALREAMCARGALGAKLTGAGGGGLVLALFSEDPWKATSDLRANGELFITSVRR